MREFNYSIIIPYRDKYDLLLKAVDSIPDREDIQVIIVDNSIHTISRERVPAKNKASVVFTTSSPERGAGGARNVGLSYAVGLYLVFLDADDYFTLSAFDSFDKFLDKDYDIVYFDAESIHLKDGSPSNRHEKIHNYLSSFLIFGDEGPLRYRYVNPIAKLIRADLVRNNQISFEEVKVSNDAMFSVLTGHFAKKVFACKDVVYMITEGEVGSTLTKSRTAENQFIRFQVAIRRFQFITSVGKKKYRPRLIGAFRFALFNFGIKEFFRYVRYARDNKVGFLNLFR